MWPCSKLEDENKEFQWEARNVLDRIKLYIFGVQTIDSIRF